MDSYPLFCLSIPLSLSLSRVLHVSPPQEKSFSVPLTEKEESRVFISFLFLELASRSWLACHFPLNMIYSFGTPFTSFSFTCLPSACSFLLWKRSGIRTRFNFKNFNGFIDQRSHVRTWRVSYVNERERERETTTAVGGKRKKGFNVNITCVEKSTPCVQCKDKKLMVDMLQETQKSKSQLNVTPITLSESSLMTMPFLSWGRSVLEKERGK